MGERVNWWAEKIKVKRKNSSADKKVLKALKGEVKAAEEFARGNEFGHDKGHAPHLTGVPPHLWCFSFSIIVQTLRGEPAISACKMVMVVAV